MAERTRRFLSNEPAASWEQLGLLTRCLTNGAPNLLAGYDANYQIVQAVDYVVILQELMHEARMIPLDGRRHVESGIRQWLATPVGAGKELFWWLPQSISTTSQASADPVNRCILRNAFLASVPKLGVVNLWWMKRLGLQAPGAR